MWYIYVYIRSDRNIETYFDEDSVHTYFDNTLKIHGVYKSGDWKTVLSEKGKTAIIVDSEVEARQIDFKLVYMSIKKIVFYVDSEPFTVMFSVNPKEVDNSDRESKLYFRIPSITHKEDNNESGFLGLCSNILNNGKEKKDRTGTGIRYLFSPKNVSYDLTDGKVPCFTTKKVAWKNTIKELLFFIKGETDSNKLLEQGINWWVGNTSREFLDNRGLNEYQVGELGKMYGWHWRRAGAKYVPQRYRGDRDGHGEGGVDQLQRLIDNIKAVKNGDYTYDRRLLLTTYIPQDLDKGVLEPCHTFVQFDVDGEFLESTLYQRSGDMFLGVQINILCYSILTHLIAKVCGLKARKFHHHLGNAHIYNNHILQMCRQLLRNPSDPPTLKIDFHENIDDYTIDDFHLEGYNPQSYIKAPMAV